MAIKVAFRWLSYAPGMNNTCSEQLIDVRGMPPRQRHPAIFGTWNQLLDGEAMLLVNDHDPVPLYFQFSCEYAGGFHWEYLDHGPKVWRVRIRKGKFASAGFVPPPPQSTAATISPITFVESLVLDTRPMFSRGETPCQAIDEAIGQLIPGQSLTLLVPFEPIPLYAKLGTQGFTHQAQRLEDGTWRVEFRR